MLKGQACIKIQKKTLIKSHNHAANLLKKMPNSSSLYFANFNEYTESGLILSICFQNTESKPHSDIKNDR